MVKSRALLLEELRRYETPKTLEKILDDLSEYPIDSEEILVTLEREHIIDILSHYLTGKLSENDVEEWANAFEMRCGDVAFGSHDSTGDASVDQEAVKDAIYLLANPVLEGALTPERARELIGRLKT